MVVTINYRLGALGFLSTGDQHAQGNWGVKDMIEAMRWVRNNIHHFGGNPNQITAFGESAGSVGVSTTNFGVEFLNYVTKKNFNFFLNFLLFYEDIS